MPPDVRLPGLIVAELTVAAAVIAGRSVGGVRGTRHALDAFATRTVASQAPAAPLAARRDLSTLPDPRVSLESTGNFMGMSDELLLERVRTQPIVRFKVNHGG